MLSRPGGRAHILYGEGVCCFCYEEHVGAPGAEALLAIFVLAPWILPLGPLLWLLASP